MYQKPKPESFEDFSQRFQLAQLLSNANRGIIFIGNTRAGKTTLSCAAAGSPIRIKHNSKFQLTFLEPSDEKYKNLVRDTNQSVTETPNFFMNKDIAIVDMPGYADSSRFKQLINFHYIKTMVTNLKEISFFIVLTLSYGEGKYQIQGAERRMLQNFAETFPQCKGCVSVIINRVQHNNVGNKNSQAQTVIGAFRNLLTHPQNVKIKRHFEKNSITKFHVFFRPPYIEKQGKDYDAPHPSLNQQISDICFNQNHSYMNIKSINTKISIFKEGDTIQNQNFKKLLNNILEEQCRRVHQAIHCYQSIIFYLIKGYVDNRLAQQQDEIQQVLDILLQKDIKVERNQDRVIDIQPYKSNQTLVQSRLVKLYLTLLEIDEAKNLAKEKMQKDKEKEKEINNAFIISTINNVMGQLVWVVNYAYPQKKKLFQKMRGLHKYIVRRFQQTLFIEKMIENKSVVDTTTLLEFANHSIYQQINEINKFSKFTNEVIENFQKLTEDLLSPISKTKFANNFSQKTKNQLISTLDSLKILNDKRIIVKDQDKCNKINERIKQKKNEIQLHYLTISAPNPNKPEQIKIFVNGLLSSYHLAQSKQQKFRFAIKIATNFVKNQQKQHAIALFLHLEIFEQALKIVDSILDPKKVEPKKTEIVLKWYQQMAEFFKNKKTITYFERCIQKAKTLCLEDIQKLIYLQKTKEEGLEFISQLPKKDISLLKKQSSGQKLQHWQWDKIDEEIQFLKFLCKPENKKKEWKVIGAKFRL